MPPKIVYSTYPILCERPVVGSRMTPEAKYIHESDRGEMRRDLTKWKKRGFRTFEPRSVVPPSRPIPTLSSTTSDQPPFFDVYTHPVHPVHLRQYDPLAHLTYSRISHACHAFDLEQSCAVNSIWDLISSNPRIMAPLQGTPSLTKPLPLLQPCHQESISLTTLSTNKFPKAVYLFDYFNGIRSPQEKVRIAVRSIFDNSQPALYCSSIAHNPAVWHDKNRCLRVPDSNGDLAVTVSIFLHLLAGWHARQLATPLCHIYLRHSSTLKASLSSPNNSQGH